MGERKANMAMQKQQRIQLIARMAPQDHARIKHEAEVEGRSLGEFIARVILERDLLRAQLQQTAGEQAR